MKSSAAVVALVTSYNDAAVIGRTIESLLSQTYPREQFYIVAVDFGSTDGTYEKLLSYDRYHFGVYQVNESLRPEQYPAIAVKFANRLTSNDRKYTFLLRAGDTVVPEASEYCTELMDKYVTLQPLMIIGEVIETGVNGLECQLPPLYSDPFVFDGTSHYLDFLNRGFNHRVFSFGLSPGKRKTYHYYVGNDFTRWNNIAYSGYRRNLLYVPKTMATLQERPDSDAFYSLASYYVKLAMLIRTSQSMYADALSKSAYDKAFRNLAYSALHSGCSEYESGNIKKAEDCLIFGPVIDPDVINDSIYKVTADYILRQGAAPKWETDVTLPPPHGAVRIN